MSNVLLSNLGSVTYNGTSLTDITRLVRFVSHYRKSTGISYDTYYVKDNETPAHIANKLYGDPRQWWIVLLFNHKNESIFSFPISHDKIHEEMVEAGLDPNDIVTYYDSTNERYVDEVTAADYKEEGNAPVHMIPITAAQLKYNEQEAYRHIDVLNKTQLPSFLESMKQFLAEV